MKITPERIEEVEAAVAEHQGSQMKPWTHVGADAVFIAAALVDIPELLAERAELVGDRADLIQDVSARTTRIENLETERREREKEIERLEKAFEYQRVRANSANESLGDARKEIERLREQLAEWKPDEKYEAEDDRILEEIEAMSEEELNEQLSAVGIYPDEAMLRTNAVIKACKRMCEERDRAESAESENAALREQIEELKGELDTALEAELKLSRLGVETSDTETKKVAEYIIKNATDPARVDCAERFLAILNKKAGG